MIGNNNNNNYSKEFLMTTLKNISLCSLLLVISFTYTSETMPIIIGDKINTAQDNILEEEVDEQTKKAVEAIESKLLIFRQIIDDTQEYDVAMEQMYEDREKFENYCNDNKNLYFWQIIVSAENTAKNNSAQKARVMEHALTAKNNSYNSFRNEFNLCKRLNNINCFNRVEKKITHKLSEINKQK